MPSQANQPLPDGYRLMNYRIASVLSCGGFSIVYLAYDEDDQPVAIKEYLPAQLALRQQGDVLPSIAEDDLRAFQYGMRCFFEEGRSLALLSHPNIVRVLNFFRANDTVYIVMRYERGRTLQEQIRAQRGAVKEAFLRRAFSQLLNGLREVHRNRLLHLDIKPANIYVRNDGTPLLLDFGAARQTLSSERARLAPMFTPGFAPPELYLNRDALGPWSDIYGIGATLHACVLGHAPPEARERLQNETYEPLTARLKGRYSPALLRTIDWCLELDHESRPQSVFVLQKVLRGDREPLWPEQKSWLARLVSALGDARDHVPWSKA